MSKINSFKRIPFNMDGERFLWSFNRIQFDDVITFFSEIITS